MTGLEDRGNFDATSGNTTTFQTKWCVQLPSSFPVRNIAFFVPVIEQAREDEIITQDPEIRVNSIRHETVKFIVVEKGSTLQCRVIINTAVSRRFNKFGDAVWLDDLADIEIAAIVGHLRSRDVTLTDRQILWRITKSDSNPTFDESTRVTR